MRLQVTRCTFLQHTSLYSTDVQLMMVLDKESSKDRQENMSMTMKKLKYSTNQLCRCYEEGHAFNMIVRDQVSNTEEEKKTPQGTFKEPVVAQTSMKHLQYTDMDIKNSS